MIVKQYELIPPDTYIWKSTTQIWIIQVGSLQHGFQQHTDPIEAVEHAAPEHDLVRRLMPQMLRWIEWFKRHIHWDDFT